MALVDEDVRTEVADREARGARAEVGDVDDAAVAVEGERRGAPAAGARRGAVGGDEPGVEQQVEAVVDGGPGEPAFSGERHAGVGGAGPHELEQTARSAGVATPVSVHGHEPGVALSLTVAACGGSDSSSGSSSSTSSASSSGGKSVGVMIKGLDNPFFAAMNDGVKAAGKSTKSNVRIQAAASLDDTSGQASKLEALIGQKMSCYVVNPISQTNLVQPLARVPDGTPVVNIDSPVGANAAKQAGLDISTYIGTDNVAAGGMAAETMAGLVKDGGTVALIGGMSGDATSVARSRLHKGASGGFDAAHDRGRDWDRAKALNAAEDLLRVEPRYQGLLRRERPDGARHRAGRQERGQKGQIAIVGVDGIEDALKAVQARRPVGDRLPVPVHDRPAGVEACVAAAQGKKLPADREGAGAGRDEGERRQGRAEVPRAGQLVQRSVHRADREPT